MTNQANSSIVDSSSSFIFRFSFPYLDRLIRTRSPAKITCVDFYKEPFVLVLVVQVQLGIQDNGLQPSQRYVIVLPFNPRRRAVGSLLRYIVYGLGYDPVILDIVAELLATSEECPDLMYVLGSVHVPDRAQIGLFGFRTMF
jgi:hypothetical protein